MSDVETGSVIDVEVSTVVGRPVADVFAFLSDMENNLKWRLSQVEVKKTSAGPIGVGTTYRMVNNLFGRRMELEAEVTEYEPYRKYTSINRSGTFPLQAQRIFQPVEGGTLVTLILRASPRGWFKLIEPLLQSAAKRRIEGDIARAKELIETDAPEPL